jgi:hypothetical protein
LVVFAALFSGSNSNSTTSWYRNYTPAEAPATTPALIPDVGRPSLGLIREYQMVVRAGG